MLTCAILKQLDESKVLQKGWPSNAVYEPTLVRRLIGHTDGIWDITCKSWHGEQRKPVYTVYTGALFLSILAFFLFFIPSLDIFLSLFSSKRNTNVSLVFVLVITLLLLPSSSLFSLFPLISCLTF